MAINKNDYFIFGSGGHGKVVLHTILALNKEAKVIFCDNNVELLHSKILNVEIVGNFQHLLALICDADVHIKGVIGIGQNSIRKKYFIAFHKARKNVFTTFLHPSAVIDSSVEIGVGSVVFANAVLHPSAKIGENVIITTAAVVEHDCVVGSHSQVAPNATLCGGVSVDNDVMICAGAIVIPYKKIGSGVTVAAGAVVINDVPDNVLVAGCPARIVKEYKNE